MPRILLKTTAVAAKTTTTTTTTIHLPFHFSFFLLLVVYANGENVAAGQMASSQQQPPPTLAARLTNPGVDFFGQIGHKLVNRELPSTEFPEILLPITGGPGTGEVRVTELQIPAQHFESPRFRFKLLPPSVIQFVSTGGLLPVNGLWSADYKVAGITFYTSGWVALVAQDIQSTLAVGVTHRKGKPQVEVFNCTAQVGQVEVQIGGGIIPWLVNLFRGSLDTTLRKAVHDQFCHSVKSTLLDELNRMLVSLPDTYQLGNSSIFLNYAYNNNIQVESTFVQSLVFADILVQNDSACSLQPSTQMPLPPPSREWMLSVWLHASMPNCLLWSVHRANLLRMSIDPSFDGGKFAKFLQTNCHIYQICLGRFFPLLAHNHPDQHVDFHFHSATAPTMQIVAPPTEANTTSVVAMRLEAKFYVDLHISPWQKNPEVLARLEMNATGGVEPRLSGGRVQGKLANMEIKFGELSSSIGNFSDRFLHTFALLATPVLESVLQSALRVGFPLPTVEDIRMAPGSELSAVVATQQLRVDTDLAYGNATTTANKYYYWKGGKAKRRRNGMGNWQWHNGMMV